MPRRSVAALRAPGVLLVPRSHNAKLGPVAALYVAHQSCPPSCPLLSSRICYGLSGNVGVHARRLQREAAGQDHVVLARNVAQAIDAAPTDRPLRLFVVGDAHCVECATVIAAAARRYQARGGPQARVWGYTHVDAPAAIWQGLAVLRSVETADAAEHAAAHGYAVARVVTAFPDGPHAWREGGLRYLPCPEQTGRRRTCADCRLCWDTERLRRQGMAIAFAAHGPRARTFPQLLPARVPALLAPPPTAHRPPSTALAAPRRPRSTAHHCP
jgi:hypothetical protein